MRTLFQAIDDFLRGRGVFAPEAPLAGRLRWLVILVLTCGLFYGAVMGTYSGLAPFTAVWYLSSADYQLALLFHAFMFGIASLAAQVVVRRYYGPLICRSPRHRLLLRVWFVLYVFVGIQMAWVLRPFIGDPRLPVAFFRTEAWGNAYVVVARLIVHAVDSTGAGSFFWTWMIASILFLTLIFAGFYAYHVVREKHHVPGPQKVQAS